jgi:osmotically-inducible protein OsmY
MSVQEGGTSLFAPGEGERKSSTRKPSVLAAATSRLRKSDYHELHLISCAFHEGVLTLRGRVSTFYLKQVAQTLIASLEGVERINNRLEVAARSVPY